MAFHSKLVAVLLALAIAGLAGCGDAKPQAREAGGKVMRKAPAKVDPDANQVATQPGAEANPAAPKSPADPTSPADPASDPTPTKTPPDTEPVAATPGAPVENKTVADEGPRRPLRIAKADPDRAKVAIVEKPLTALDEYDLPGPAKMPRPRLSDAHAKSCKKNVGDALPDVELTDANGKTVSLSAQYGKRLTVVFVWNADYPFAVEELGDLGPMVTQRFGERGVNVVAINSGNEINQAKAVLESTKSKLISLFDPQGKFLEQVSTDRLPRTYLIDATGKILWLDLEYSRTTRRELQRALQASLTEI